MMAINHFVTGAVIGTAIPNPWIGVPAAVASHFVLDALPHYGCKEFRDDNLAEKKLYFTILIIDGALFLALMAIALFTLDNALLAVYGFLAFSPDMVWVYRYGLLAPLGMVNKPPGKIERFHMHIQKFEKPVGLLVEIPYLVIVGGVLLKLIG